MRKTVYFLAILATAITVACNNGTQENTNTTEGTDSTSVNQEETLETNSPTEEATPSSESQVLNLNDMTEGDAVGNLTVSKIEATDEYAKVIFDGEMTFSANVYENPMEYIAEMEVKDCTTKIIINGTEQPLFSFMELTNAALMTEQFTDEQMANFKNASVPVTITVRHPETYFNFGDKGRLAFGKAEFVKMN